MLNSLSDQRFAKILNWASFFSKNFLVTGRNFFRASATVYLPRAWLIAFFLRLVRRLFPMLVHEQIDLPGSYRALFLHIVASLRKFFTLSAKVQHRIEVVAAFAANAPLFKSVDEHEEAGSWVFTLAQELDADIDEAFIYQCSTFTWVIERLSELSPLQRRWLEDLVTRLDPLALVGTLPESWNDHSLEALASAFSKIEPQGFGNLGESESPATTPEHSPLLQEAMRAMRELSFVAHGLKPIPLDEDVDLWQIANEACFELFIRLPHNEDVALKALADESNAAYYDSTHTRVRKLMKAQRIGTWRLARRIRKRTGVQSVTASTLKRWLSPGFLSTDQSRRLLAAGLGVSEKEIEGTYDNVFNREYYPRLRAGVDAEMNIASYRSEIDFAALRTENFRKAFSALAKKKGKTISELAAETLGPYETLATIVASDDCPPPSLLDVYLFSQEVAEPVEDLWAFE